MLIDLIPHIVWLGKTVNQRYKDIGSIGTAVNKSAAIACELGHYELALEWLEQGRSVVWGQILLLCTPVDDLRQERPELASEIEEIAQKLERLDLNLSPLPNSQHQNQISLEETAQARWRLAERWEALIGQVRNLSGFEDFLRPKRASKFVMASNLGAVVVINVDTLQSDALVLKSRSSDITHAHLASASYQKLHTAYASLMKMILSSGLRLRTPTVEGTLDKELTGLDINEDQRASQAFQG